MALSAKNLKKANREFYNSGDAVVFSDTYSVPLSLILRSLNTIGSLLYVGFSTAIALRVMEKCKVYAFVRQAGQKDLAGTEVLSWAQTQASAHKWDIYAVGILLLGAVLIITQIATKLFIKKYTVYKLERPVLWLTLILTLLQWGLALWGSTYFFTFDAWIFCAVLGIAFVVLTIVFLLGLFAAKLPYPMEFKQYENLERILQIANSVASILQKCILR